MSPRESGSHRPASVRGGGRVMVVVEGGGGVLTTLLGIPREHWHLLCLGAVDVVRASLGSSGAREETCIQSVKTAECHRVSSPLWASLSVQTHLRGIHNVGALGGGTGKGLGKIGGCRTLHFTCKSLRDFCYNFGVSYLFRLILAVKGTRNGLSIIALWLLILCYTRTKRERQMCCVLA